MFPNQNLNKTKQKKKLQERGRGENREIKATVMLQGISFFEEHKTKLRGHALATVKIPALTALLYFYIC